MLLALVGLGLLVIAVRWRRTPLKAPPPLPAHSQGALVNVSDPQAITRLVKGFYTTDNDYWRWTAREFSIILSRPEGADRTGAILMLRFAIAPESVARLKSLDLSTTVDGVALPRQHYEKAGQFISRQGVPAEALKFDPVRVDFSLDKALQPSNKDPRELGLVVSQVGFEPK